MWWSKPHFCCQPHQGIPLKAEGQISMTMEVSELLSQAVLDTLGLESRSSTPKSPGSQALAAMLPLKPDDSAQPVETSSQVSTPENAEMDDPTVEEIQASPPPPVETWGPSGEAPSVDVARLQEEANKALDCLLVTRSSINVQWRKQVSDFGMALHQHGSDTIETIKKVKAVSAHTIQDAETCWTVLISDAEVWHTAHIKEIEDGCAHISAEAENCCSSASCYAESLGASNTHSIQQFHAKDIQHLEAEAMKEEGRDPYAFLTACSATLRPTLLRPMA